MPRSLQILLFVLLSATAITAQAQANLVHGIVAGMMLGRKAANGDFADKSVTHITYREQQYPLKRTPPEMLTGASTEQIGLLETQLEQCHAALFADTTGAVCPAERLTAIKAAQGILAQARPGWNQKAYRAELAFYVAEDARRQRVAARNVPAR